MSIRNNKIERSFELQATYAKDVIRVFFDMLYIGVCTTKDSKHSCWIWVRLDTSMTTYNLHCQ